MNQFKSAFQTALTNSVQRQKASVSRALLKYVQDAAPRLGIDDLSVTPTSSMKAYYDIQTAVRGVYKKEGKLEPNIGGHPDFQHLEGSSNIEFNHVVTLFMDIESSTRLNLLYPPEEVILIKNSFISCAIALVRAFDGHVHRIMGDAIMAFFGGRGTQPEEDVLKAISCASLLMHFAEHIVRKQLEEIYGYGDPFGIRIGVDYGPEDKVAWAFYGYPGSSEITATSFYVDVASKLQHAAPRNGVMIGQSLRDFIDIPRQLTEVKTYVKDGEPQEEPCIRPNLTDKEGRSINYKQFIFNWAEFLKCTPAIWLDPEGIVGHRNILAVQASIYDSKEGKKLFDLVPTGNYLEKGLWIKFQVNLPYPLQTFPAFMSFSVENHGSEAKAGGDSSLRLRTQHRIDNHKDISESLVQWEHTKYRGVHYMISGFKHNDRVYTNIFGVAIL